MTEEKEETLEFIAPGDAVELIDLGDALKETKQQFPHGVYPDCYFWTGTKPGCSG